MRKLVYVVVLAALSCETETERGFEAAMLGRWDVVVHGEDGYPAWFELVESDGTLSGRLQPRGGHARELTAAEASGNRLMMEVLQMTFEGTLEGDEWSGTGMRDGASFDWTAVRAPELPAATNPQWGEPIELFNREDLTGWTPRHPDLPNQWRGEGDVLVNAESGSDLMTEGTFDDFKLHIEVNVPEGSNSGIYLRGRHEVQVQDDHGKELGNRIMGAVYGQITPTTNPTLPADEWQSFDITLLGRWVTVVLNGETIIDHQEIPGITGGALDSDEGAPGPILLQGDHGRVLYRNIVLTPAVP